MRKNLKILFNGAFLIAILVMLTFFMVNVINDFKKVKSNLEVSPEGIVDISKLETSIVFKRKLKILSDKKQKLNKEINEEYNVFNDKVKEIENNKRLYKKKKEKMLKDLMPQRKAILKKAKEFEAEIRSSEILFRQEMDILVKNSVRKVLEDKKMKVAYSKGSIFSESLIDITTEVIKKMDGLL